MNCAPQYIEIRLFYYSVFTHMCYWHYAQVKVMALICATDTRRVKEVITLKNHQDISSNFLNIAKDNDYGYTYEYLVCRTKLIPKNVHINK